MTVRRVLSLALVVSVLVVGCGHGGGDAGAGDQAAQLEAARARWEAAGIEDYAWRFTRSCFCPPLSAEVRVAGGEAADVSRLTDPSWGDDLPELEFTTMEELFDLIEGEIDAGEVVTASYDPQTGRVRHFDAAGRSDTVDDERGYEVTSFLTGDEVDDGSTRVVLTVEAQSPSAGVVEVEGTATVPDAANVNWALSHPRPPDGCPVDVAPEVDPCNAPYGRAMVRDGRFAFRVDGLDPGEVEVFVAFDPLAGDQPPAIGERYGPRGQRMTGPQVVDYGGGAYRAQTTQMVEVG